MDRRRKAPWLLASDRHARAPRRDPSLDQRWLAVPALWSGSVEHFYHFLLGYLLPVTLLISDTDVRRLTVRDCGPMNPWWDLLTSAADLEVIAPGQMLQRLVRGDQEARVLAPMDDPASYTAESLTTLRSRGWRYAGDEHGLDGNTMIVRGPSHPFFTSAGTEVPESGSERRSIPRADAIAAALNLDLCDFADLSPMEQIRTARRSSLLVGQHGAGLANMVWMKPGGHLVEIQPPQGPGESEMFRLLAEACGLHYSRLDQEHDHAEIDSASLQRLLTQ